METKTISLVDFQAISKGENDLTTKEIIDKIKEGFKYIVVSDDGDYKVMLYKNEDGEEILGLNKL